jgi:hypothetical protein
MKKFLSALLVLFVLIAVGGPHRQRQVITEQDYQDDVANQNGQNGDVIVLPDQIIKPPAKGIVETLFVSPNVGGDVWIALNDAAAAWEVATNNIVTFHIVTLGQKFSLMEERKNDIIYRTITVRVADENETIVKLIDKFIAILHPGHMTIGYFDADNIQEGIVQDLFIVASRADSPQELRRTFIHELGHSIDMMHIETGSAIMNPSEPDAPDNISILDLQQFCDIYMCNPEELNPIPAICTSETYVK